MFDRMLRNLLVVGLIDDDVGSGVGTRDLSTLVQSLLGFGPWDLGELRESEVHR